MSDTRPDFPEVLDSTIIAAFRSCAQKAYREFFQHWKSKEPSVHLHAGAAYAHGLEVARRCFFEEGLSEEDAVAMGAKALLEHYGDFQCPPDSAKSAERTLGAYAFYHERYAMSTDNAVPIVLSNGKRMIEFNGVEPLDIAHPVTGNPIQYSWRMDQGVTLDGMRLGEDDKTTSQLGASWPRQWDLRSQFTGYMWGSGKAGQPLDGFLIRGVSILKRGHDTLQAITYRPQWMIDRWYEQVLRDVKRMIAAWKDGYFDFALDHACVEYGGCPFKNVCLNREPQAVLDAFFERRRWDPVLRKETKL